MGQNNTVTFEPPIPFTDDDFVLPFKEMLIVYAALGVLGVIILDVLIYYLITTCKNYFTRKQQDQMLRKEYNLILIN